MTARPTISGSSAPQLLPDPLSEAHGDLSLTEAASFLRILEGVLAKEAAPLGPAALLAVLCFLKRVAALGAWEPEPTTGPWEQLGQAVMSVASLVLEEPLAGVWLSVSEVRLAGLGATGPWALVPTLSPICVAMGKSAPISELHFAIHLEKLLVFLFYKLNFHKQLLLNNSFSN